MRISRREFLISGGIAVGTFPWQQIRAAVAGVQVNDVHSQLNLTTVRDIMQPNGEHDILLQVQQSLKTNQPLAVCGARHAAGGQQFLRDHTLIDVTKFSQVTNFNKEAGVVTVQSGLQWDAMQRYLDQNQTNQSHVWAINQKQTGLNTLTIGGTVGANAHGQGLQLKPFVQDIESFRLATGTGERINCSRTENKELFALVVGGYGLFGIVLDLNLKLVAKQKVKRKLKQISLADLETEYNGAVERKCRYAHFQINIDDTSNKFLEDGFFSSYESVPNDTPVTRDAGVTPEHWLDMVHLAHTNRAQAFKNYVALLQSSDSTVDWADEWQNNLYVPNYHARFDDQTPATEVLTEFFVPMSKLEQFLVQAKQYFVQNNLSIIYSVVRFIEKDTDSFLPWAKERFVCVIFNFHTVHTKSEIAKTMAAFSFLIDKAIEASGTFYLTYQHVATRKQLLACYPEFNQFLVAKQKYDPKGIFQSDWYRWHRNLLK